MGSEGSGSTLAVSVCFCRCSDRVFKEEQNSWRTPYVVFSFCFVFRFFRFFRLFSYCCRRSRRRVFVTWVGMMEFWCFGYCEKSASVAFIVIDSACFYVPFGSRAHIDCTRAVFSFFSFCASIDVQVRRVSYFF